MYVCLCVFCACGSGSGSSRSSSRSSKGMINLIIPISVSLTQTSPHNPNTGALRAFVSLSQDVRATLPTNATTEEEQITGEVDRKMMLIEKSLLISTRKRKIK